MPNEWPSPENLPPPLPGQSPPPLPSAMVPPPLPVAMPTVPVAKPVARAVPIKAEPKVEQSQPNEPSKATSFTRSENVEHHQARPQVKMAFLVVAGLLLFGCCGIGVVGYAFVQFTKQIALSERNPNPPETVNEPPVMVPITKTQPSTKANPVNTTPSSAPRRTETPPIAPPPTAPKLNVNSPVGTKGLIHYVSFDNATVREDRSRTTLGFEGVIRLLDGPRNKAASPFVLPDRGEEGPKFAIDFSAFVDSFRFKDESPFTIALWVRGGGTDGIAFALVQDSLELGPKLLVRLKLASVEVEFYCDETDSDKKFVRTKALPKRPVTKSFTHVALTRSAEGTLTVYVDAEPIADAPADSLPAKQPVALKFKRAGFGLRAEKLPYTIDLDEFCLFDRALAPDEIKTMVGKVAK